MDLHDFAQQHLFSKIGLGYPHDTVGWYRDDVGHVTTYDGIQLGCRALARMGHLWLNNGTWADGSQVVSEGFVRGSVQSSTPLNAAYGHLWWLGKQGHWVMPSNGSGRVEGDGASPFFLPGDDDAFGMLGGQAQIAIVDPRRNAVYVRQGDPPPAGDYAFQRGFLQKIRDAQLDARHR